MKLMLLTYVAQVIFGVIRIFTSGETTHLARQILIKWIPWRQELVWVFPGLLSSGGLSNILIVPHTMSPGWMSEWDQATSQSF